MTYAADTSLTATLKGTVKEAEPVDTVPPVISGADDVAVEFGASFDPMAGVKVVDDVDGDVTGAVKVSGDTVDASKPGAYTLVYTVSDAAGNEASVTRVATVKEKSGETPASLATRIRTATRSPTRSRARIPTRTVIRTTKATRSRACPRLTPRCPSLPSPQSACLRRAPCLWRFAAVATSKARIS